FGHQRGFAFATDFKIQSERFRADATDVNGDFQKIVQLRCAPKVALKMRARQPHVQLVEHHPIGQPDRAEEFGFRKLEEAYVSAVENDARRVNVAPAHALFDDKLFHTEIRGKRLVEDYHLISAFM